MFQLLILPVLFLFFFRTPAEEVKQFPPLIMAQEGDTINVTCTTSGKSFGLYLKRHLIRFMEVIYFSKENKSIITKSYKNRTIISGTLNNLVITISNIQLDDTDFYICQATTSSNTLGNGTMVAVTEKKQKKEDGHLGLVLIVTSFFIGLVLGPLLMMLKKLVDNSRKTQNTTCTIYEDMSYVIQHNTSCENNQYN
ncbi:T-cell antigen CD7 [Petaurus breviceps papuanus]|uniref:T-cell antigen CD7 n=1 Tax=Petaurus breviceps papuanus TaxID=3040969 RepID=UPI0036DECC03